MSRIQRKKSDEAGCSFAPLCLLPSRLKCAALPWLTRLYLLLCLVFAPLAAPVAQGGGDDASKPLELVRKTDGTVQGSGGRYALIVGINDYNQAGLGQLRYSEKDAQAVHSTLIQYGGFPPGNVRLLLGPEATDENIVEYLNRLSDASVFPDADTFLF